MKKFLSLVLALVMTMSLVTVSAGAKDFTDDSKITYKEAVDVISALGVVDGYTDDSFRPDDVLTRGAAAKIICNLILGPTTASALSADTAPFRDVPVSNNFAGYITYCSQQKIINGYGDGTFRPTGTLSGNAFMKMLLGALGYDSSVERYTGANWTVAVVKQAVGIGLDDGNDEFVGSKAVTREEAALYAFNMLQATMVEYDAKTTFDMNGATVTIAGDKAQDVSNANGKTDGYIEPDDKMQFAERYFTDLRKIGDSDEFNRPATTWRYDGSTVGTYTNTADETYTAEVKMGDIYKDLGLSRNLAVKDVTVYTDGAASTSYGITKGDETNKLGGNGVLTEVFYDKDNDTAIISVINTYLGEVTSTHAASGSRDAYITVEAKYDNLAVTGGNFDTNDSYSEGDLVLFSYSNKAGDKGVQNVRSAAEAVTGTLSSFTAEKNATVGGTEYKVNKANASELKDLENAVSNGISIYLDEYGYIVYVDTDAVDNNYAVVLGYTSGTGSVAQTVKLLTTDGGTMNVSVKSISSANSNAFNVGDIVRYTKTSNNEYKLEVIADKFSLTSDVSDYALFTKGSDSIGFKGSDNTNANTDKTGSATVTRATGKTIFLVATGNDVYNVYQGIANVPTITVKASKTPSVAVYVKDVNSAGQGSATVVFIDASTAGDIEMSGLSKDAVFVNGSTSTKASYNEELGTYYAYDAIINGEFDTIFSANRVTAKTLFGDVTYDTNGVATLSNGIDVSGADVAGTASNGRVSFGIGIDKSGDDVMILGTGASARYLTLADGYKVYKLTVAGDIDETTYSSFSKDTNDKVWVKEVDGDVTTIVIWEQDPAAEQFSFSAVTNAQFSLDNSTWTATSAAAGTKVYVRAAAGYKMLTTGDLALTSEGSGVYSFTMPERALVATDIDLAATYAGKVDVRGGSISTGYYDATFYNKNNDGALTVAEMVEALVAKINDNGGVVTNQNFGTGDVSYTYNGGTYSVKVATTAQVYAVNLNGTTTYMADGASVITTGYYTTDNGTTFSNSALTVNKKDLTVVDKYVEIALPASITNGGTESTATLAPVWAGVTSGEAAISAGKLYVQKDTEVTATIEMTVSTADITTPITVSSTACTLSDNTGKTANTGEKITVTATFSAAQTASDIASLNLTTADT